jgi:hypothetical protein
MNAEKVSWTQRRQRLLLFRLLVAVALTLGLMSIFAATTLAGDGGDVRPEPVDKLCVVGTVIDHAEKPLGGWTVTAVKYLDDGTLDPPTAMEEVSDDQGRFRFDNLSAGRWNFSIEVRNGWEPVTSDSFDINVRYGDWDCQTIRFKMRQPVTVFVLKIDANHQPLSGWTIHAHPAPGNYFASPKREITNELGIATFKLTTGRWIFSESPPATTSFIPVAPATGVQELDVVAPGPHTIRFKNLIYPDLKGCIEVVKTDVPPPQSGQPAFGLPGWLVTVERADGSIAASGRTNALGRIVFDNLPYGPYVVTEEMQAGWEPDSPTAVKVTLIDSYCKVVEFHNKQLETGFCIDGRKIDANGYVGLPGWEIIATPLSPGGYEPEPVFTDGLGEFRINFPMNDYRIPGARYQVCEKDQPGWLPHTSTCQVVRLPVKPGACVRLPYDFKNQQVGHTESKKHPYPVVCSQTHIVQAGEQLYLIGQRYGRTPQQMLNANPAVRGRPHYVIYRGESICIP